MTVPFAMRIVYPRDTWRLLYPVRVLLAGLLAAEVVATVIVWRSNHALFHKLSAIQASGYSPLPGINIAPPLVSLEAAWTGAVFFMLSIGAGITLLTFAAVLLVQAAPDGVRRPLIWPLLAVWGGVLVWANAGGVSLNFSAFLLLVPPVVVMAAVRGRPSQPGNVVLPWRRSVHVLLIGLLLLLWLPRINSDVFVNIKDNLLLTSRPGIRTVDLYYRYTLYAAEVFQSFAQKQITAHAMTGPATAAIQPQVGEALAGVNCFPVADSRRADILIERTEAGDLVLKKGQSVVQTVTPRALMASPWPILLQYSADTDINANFRLATIASLLGIAPLVLYLTTFALFGLVPGLFLPIRISSFLVPVLCCIFWSAAIVCLDTPSTADLNRERVVKAMAEGTRKEKIGALRYIHHNGLEITAFSGYREMLDNRDFAQRYWMVKCLGKSRHPLAMQWIVQLMQSESPYIICKAMEAGAGQQTNRNRQGYIQALVQKLKLSSNWYVQYYAFRVAREYGWKPEGYN